MLRLVCLTVKDGAIRGADLHSPERQSAVGFLGLLSANTAWRTKSHPKHQQFRQHVPQRNRLWQNQEKEYAYLLWFHLRTLCGCHLHKERRQIFFYQQFAISYYKHSSSQNTNIFPLDYTIMPRVVCVSPPLMCFHTSALQSVLSTETGPRSKVSPDSSQLLELFSNSLAAKRLWMARVTLKEGSSRHCARQLRAWPWTVEELSIRRANSRLWIRNLCGRKQASSGSGHSSGCLSGCSSRTITTSMENSRCTIYRSQSNRLTQGESTDRR